MADKSVISLVCERAADLGGVCDAQGAVKEVPGLHVIKLPCSGMIQPLMIDQAMKSGAEGVIVMGCQIGDCYYREGNKMIRERLLGERQPGLKKTVDRRRVIALWLSRVQTKQFLSEAREFVASVRALPPVEAAKPSAAATPAAKAAAATPAAKAAAVPTPATETPKAAEKKVDTAKVVDSEKESKDAALASVQGAKGALGETKVETGSLANNPKDGEKSPDITAPVSDVATPEPKGDETK
jgi:F420-non-reducing hydrogenase iron-sulfur subunit